MRTLSDLNEYVIRRMFYFSPSIWQVIELRKTNVRFNQLCRDHMISLTSVDFRTPAELDSTSLERPPTELFGPNLVKVKCNANSETTSSLQLSHPYLFPKFRKELFNEPESDGLTHPSINEPVEGFQDYEYSTEGGEVMARRKQEVLTVYKSLYSRTVKSKAGNYLVLGRQRKLHMTWSELTNLCLFVAEHNTGCGQPFAAVDTLVLSKMTDMIWYHGNFSDLASNEMFVSVFSGLKVLIVHIGFVFGQSPGHLSWLRNRFGKCPFEIYFENDKVSAHHPHHFSVPEVYVFLDSRASYQKIPPQDIVPASEVSPEHVFQDRCVLFMTFTKEQVVGNIPCMADRVVLSKPEKPVMVRLLDFLETSGDQIVQMCILEYRGCSPRDGMTDRELKLLFESIGRNCQNLTNLRLECRRDTQFPLHSMKYLVRKIGSKLSHLEICSPGTTEDWLVVTIAGTCKKLKSLYLELAMGSDSDDTAVKLKRLHHLKRMSLKMNVLGLQSDSQPSSSSWRISSS